MNDGTGHFEFKALPRLAQITASYGVTFTDVDGDGSQDMLLSQNSYAPQLETGHFDGGQGLLLEGMETGNLTLFGQKTVASLCQVTQNR
jgi:hypothetical protein